MLVLLIFVAIATVPSNPAMLFVTVSGLSSVAPNCPPEVTNGTLTPLDVPRQMLLLAFDHVACASVMIFYAVQSSPCLARGWEHETCKLLFVQHTFGEDQPTHLAYSATYVALTASPRSDSLRAGILSP